MIREGVRRVDIGGLDLSSFMSRLLEEKGLTTKFSNQLVQNLCFVASDLQLELNNPHVKTSYQLPDGQVKREIRGSYVDNFTNLYIKIDAK